MGAKLILATILSALFICPLTFRLAHLSNEDVQSDLFAGILTVILSGSLICILHNILKRRSQTVKANFHEEKVPRMKIFRVFSSSTLPASFLTPKDKGSRANQDTQKSRAPESHKKKPKVDPKYFKPKFIIHELLSIWGTTYTVITWGSFWVIGGTIVATEKLATKIKTKYSRDVDTVGANMSSTSFESDFNQSSDSTGTPESSSGRDPFRSARTWTRKSFATARKRLFKCFRGVSLPQLTEVTGNRTY